MGIIIKVKGKYACFTRPEFKVERVSYDFITPSAAKGVLDAIFWEPQITWVVDKIHVLNPIKFTNIKRNEVSAVALNSHIKSAMERGYDYAISTEDSRHQRNSMILKDVAYVIEAHFNLNREKLDRDNLSDKAASDKYYAEIMKRLKVGKCYYQPWLGTREFSASFELIESANDIPKSALTGEQDFGWMLHDMGWKEKGKDYSVNPKFFKAVTVGGVCDLTSLSEVIS